MNETKPKYYYVYSGDITKDLVARTLVDLTGVAAARQYSELVFMISSTGGDIDSAIRLYEFLRVFPLPVKIIGFGQVESAATLVFCAGKHRISTRNCRFRLHEGTVTLANVTLPLSTHKEELLTAEARREAMISIYVETLKTNKGEVEDILRAGKPMTPDEAIEFGLATGIEDRLFD